MNKLSHCFSACRTFSTSVKPFCYLSKFKEFTDSGNYVNAVDIIQRAPASAEKTKLILSALPSYINKAVEENAKEQGMECWHYKQVANLVKSLPPSAEKTHFIQKYISLLTTKDNISNTKDVISYILTQKETSACITLIEMSDYAAEEMDKLFANLIERIVRKGPSYTNRAGIRIHNQYDYIDEILRKTPEGLRREKMLIHALKCLDEKNESTYVDRIKTSFSPLRASTWHIFSSEKKMNTAQKIDEVLAKRLSDPDAELERLRSNPQCAALLDYLSQKHYLAGCKRKQICIARSMELQNHLQSEGYYVINHGQTNRAATLNLVSTAVQELKTKKPLTHYEILRDPCFLHHIPQDRTIEKLKKLIRSGSIDHDFREELLCGDINLRSTAEYESAIDFFANRAHGIADGYNPNFIVDRINKIVDQYIENEQVASQITKDIWEICKDIPGGVLYSICIPKGKFDALAYLSGPYGRPIEEQHTPSFELDDWQKGKGKRTSPQVRLATKELSAENGVFILPHSVLTPKQRQNIKSVIKRLLTENSHVSIKSRQDRLQEFRFETQAFRAIKGFPNPSI